MKKIYNMLTVAAVALLATACNDTDAQYDIPIVGAPQLVSATPETSEPLLFGEQTFTITFDKNIGFATANASKITLNGTPVKKALVLGAAPTLTITADVDFKKTQNLVIPAGLIVGSQGAPYDKEINLTWTIGSLPSNDATAITQKLGWGWNLGNHFDTSGDAIKNGWGYWDGVDKMTAAPFQTLASVGAKTLRMPVTWTDHMNESNVISADYLNEVAAAVDLAIGAGLNVIINTHHDSFEQLALPTTATSSSSRLSTRFTPATTGAAAQMRSMPCSTSGTSMPSMPSVPQEATTPHAGLPLLATPPTST